MNDERILIIGDIHGCLDLLKRLMEKINWDAKKDRLIFLGDYIDRGKDSRGVIDYILDLQKQSSRIECLKGNHEAVFLDYLSGGDGDRFLMNGGTSTLASYVADGVKGPVPMIPGRHERFLLSLKMMVELDDFYVVHAGFRPGVPIEKQNQEDMLWIRRTFIYSNHDFGKKIIFGHTPLMEPLIMENKIGIDTGAVYGRKLTCLELPGMIFHSVPV